MKGLDHCNFVCQGVVWREVQVPVRVRWFPVYGGGDSSVFCWWCNLVLSASGTQMGAWWDNLSTISRAWKTTLWWIRSISRQPNRNSVIPTCQFPSTDSAIFLASCLTYQRSMSQTKCSLGLRNLLNQHMKWQKQDGNVTKIYNQLSSQLWHSINFSHRKVPLMVSLRHGGNFCKDEFHDTIWDTGGVSATLFRPLTIGQQWQLVMALPYKRTHQHSSLIMRLTRNNFTTHRSA